LDRLPSGDEILDGLTRGSRVPLSEIRRHPHGRVFDDLEVRVEPADPDCHDRLDVGNADMLRELEAIWYEAALSPADEDYPFRLISRRLPNVYNSTGRDIPRLNGRKPWNPAFLHPEDLAELGLAAGDLVEIRSSRASILGIAEPAPEVRRGVVSMAHCFGDAPRDEPEGSVRAIGSNTGRLIDNADVFDPHTGIPRMSAIPVAIRRAPE
jgi:anaerobic selenocysteine-containing dehydrogenase